MTTKITDANLDSNSLDNTNFNIGLLGFKMAVNEGLTVFNLVDGVVDEFNDESGTDEAEGSNDFYCATDDFYKNSQSNCISAGFTMTTVTEPDTSTAGTNPAQGSGTMGVYTVPACTSSINMFAWGAAGSTDGRPKGPGIDEALVLGGGGGYASGTLAVTPGQSLYILAGEGGESGSPNVSPYPSCFARGGFFGGGSNNTPTLHSSGGGNTGIFAAAATSTPQITAPQVYLIAGSGGGAGNDASLNIISGYNNPSCNSNTAFQGGGGGGGCTAQSGTAAGGGQGLSQTNSFEDTAGGGAGDQEQGGQGGGPNPGSQIDGQPGGFLTGGSIGPSGVQSYAGAGGAGYYGGGSGARGTSVSNSEDGSGGGGSGYTGHPQITSATKTRATTNSGAGRAQPNYVAGTSESGSFLYGTDTFPYTVTAADSTSGDGEDGYILITASGTPSATSTTIVSTAFSSTSVPTNSRIVVFEENIDTPTLNTDIIASVSRDGGTTFTNATLSDSGYVTGSSGQRILTGQADISGQPSGQSMRWKLALANNQVKIHGVSLQWS